MSFKDKMIVCGCFLGYYACMIGTKYSILWTVPACLFAFAALCFIDAKVKK